MGNFVSNMVKGFHVVKFLAKKHTPELMIVAGVGCMVGAVVTAFRSHDKVTLHLAEGVNESNIINQNLADLRSEERHEEMVEAGFTEEGLTRELVQSKVRTGAVIAKDLTPTALFFVSGVSLIVGSHCIMANRLNGALAAYTALDQAFKAYRDRVKEVVGEEKERDIRYGTHEVTIGEMHEDGSTTESKVKIPEADNPYFKSPYSRFFDSTSKNWQDDPEQNKFFLTMQQSTANDMLKARGHLFLNEVYDLLGLERSTNGALVGWVMGNGDDYVDFGMYDIFSEANRRFNNGYEPIVLLDFNVDGVIYDKIGKIKQ